MKRAVGFGAALLLTVAPVHTVRAQERTRVATEAELPVFNYPVTHKLESIVRSDSLFRPLAASVERDLERVLRQYAIEDRAAESALRRTLLRVHLLQGRDSLAAMELDSLRARQEKPTQRLLAGIEERAIIAARASSPPTNASAFRTAFERQLSLSLAPMPSRVVGEELRSMLGAIETENEASVLADVRESVQPVVAKTGALTSAQARRVINARFALVYLLPLRAMRRTAYANYVAANPVIKRDIWPARTATLTETEGLTRVVIGIWDSGVDASVFKSLMMRDGAGNALHIAFDKYSQPSPKPLATLPDSVRRHLDLLMTLDRGLADLDAGVASRDAAFAKRHMASLKPAAAAQTDEELSVLVAYMHGTMVASVAVAGNPAARVLPARMEFSRSRIPDPCPSRAQADRDARVMRETIAFFQQHGARVVNMSWSRPESGFLRELESCASQLPVAERQAIARYHVETIRAAVKASLRAAPEILFVRAAGNSGASVAFENCGACARVPNQIVVGAVDRGGDETSITNVGEDVVVHANGQNIEVLEPGGGRTLASGTSFAAPAVVNTVAKLLAVRPTLTTTEIVRVLACTADRSVDGRVRLLNERRALELVERSASPSLSCQPQ